MFTTTSTTTTDYSVANAPILYNPIELTMANGFVSAAPPKITIPPSSAHQESYQSSSVSTHRQEEDDYSLLKEVPYPEGYVPKEKKEVKKAKEGEKPLSRAMIMAKAQAIRMNGTKTRFDQKKKKKMLRVAGGEVWDDPSLQDWDANDFRLFCGDLGNEVNDDMLFKAFVKYPSLQKVKVVRDKRTSKTKGYGFVSFKDPNDFVKAMREMNGKYVGNRPIKLRKSTWDERNAGGRWVFGRLKVFLALILSRRMIETRSYCGIS
ncbi:hypothetical protein BC829DRAFT_374327 [Chytridium lagenaria]|nr:hypothetical protein BC829DRAFT_374327 [Chytridium lagenaria]